MEILARGVGRRKEAVAQVQIVKGTGQFIINQIPAQQYLHNNTCSILSVKAPLDVYKNSTSLSESQNVPATTENTNSNEVSTIKEVTTDFNPIETIDTIVKVKGGGLIGQAEAIKLGLARALCQFNNSTNPDSTNLINLDQIRKELKDKGYLTQDSRVKERKKYGLKKARKATQYNKR